MDKKIYIVEWHDAYSSPGWHNEQEMKKFIEKGKCICVNVGWIVSETKHEIVIASRRFKIEMDGEMQWGLLEKIPKAWIQKKALFSGKSK